MSDKSRRDEKRYPLAFALTVLLFAVWGGAHRVFGIVSPQFERFFALSYLQSSIIFLSFNLSYFLVALPVAMFLRRFGYKLGLVSGLAAFSLGALLLYPAVVRHEVVFQSASIVVTGIGWAFLEVSANALIVRMGPVETAVWRLNLAQCFYPAGLIVAAFLGQSLTVPSQGAFGQFVSIVVRPYIIVGLGVLLLAIVIENADFPRVASERTRHGTGVIDDLKALCSSPAFRNGVAVIAAYTTGLVCLWGSTARYAHHVLSTPPAYGWAIFSMTTWWLCAVGRIAGTGLMSRIDPMRLLAAFAAFAVVLCAIPAVSDSVVGLACMVGASFFISIMFPTIFAQTIKDLGASTKIGAGVMVAASGLGGFVAVMAQRTLFGYAGFVHVCLAVAGLSFMVVLRFAMTAVMLRPAKIAEIGAETTNRIGPEFVP